MFLKHTAEKWKIIIRLILFNLGGLCRISPPELVAEEFTNSESVIHLPNLRYLLHSTNPDDLTDYPGTDAAVAPMWSRTHRSEEASPTVSKAVGGFGTAMRATRALSSDEVTFAGSYRNPSLGQLQDLPGEMRNAGGMWPSTKLPALRSAGWWNVGVGWHRAAGRQTAAIDAVPVPDTTRVCPPLPPPRAASPRPRTRVRPAPPLPPVLRGRSAHLKQVVSSPVGFRQGYRVVAILFSEQTSLQGGESEY